MYIKTVPSSPYLIQLSSLLQKSSLEPIPRDINTETLLRPQAGWLTSLRGPTRETASGRTELKEKTMESTGGGGGGGDNEAEWTWRAEIRKKSLAVGEACMAIIWPPSGFNREYVWLPWVLNIGDPNSCIRSTPTVWAVNQLCRGSGEITSAKIESKEKTALAKQKLAALQQHLSHSSWSRWA